MDIILITTITAWLFVVIGVAEPLAARLKLPYGVMLAAVGISIGVGATFFLQTKLTDALNPVAEAILGLPIRSNIFLYVFLPTLLFQAVLGMNVRRMLDDWVPILVLAVVAVVVAMLSVGYALSWTSALPLTACLLIGAIVSTTDPSAVVSIFRSISAPGRLTRIIEGESLLNDAAAIALFSLFMGFVMVGPDPTLGSALASFPTLIVGGACIGWLGAHVAVWVMARFARYELAQISISIALPYLAYIGAEQIFGASGVIAVVAASLTLNLTGPERLSPQAWASLREVWGFLAHWAGALIFILAALLIPRLLAGWDKQDFILIGVVVAAATVARIVILFGLLPLLSAFRLSPAVDRPYRIAILWGGLRGAVTLALALAVTESVRVSDEVKHSVGILATGFTLFTLMVQGTTLRWIIGRLGLDKLSPLDQALSDQVIAVALQSVREEASKTTKNHELTHDIVRSEAECFGERMNTAIRAAEDDTAILDRDRIKLGLIVLAGAEQTELLKSVREGTISGKLAEQMLSNASRLMEAAQTEGRSGYRRVARTSVGYGRDFRVAVFLHNRIAFSRPLTRMTADRFELLLSQRLVLRDLDGFIDGRIRRIHGRRVASILHELLAQRVEMGETTLKGLRLQYPGYAEELERRFIRRNALRLEEREYEAMHEDGLIGSELHTALIQDIAQRRIAVDERPQLDLQVKRAELVRQFPLFAGFDQATHEYLGKALVACYMNADKMIIKRGNTAKSVYFIASGAVELESAGQTWRLGRGEMFGQLSLLMQKPRHLEVRTIAPSTLLVLDKPRFRRLLEKSPMLRDIVLESATRRGIASQALFPDDL